MADGTWLTSDQAAAALGVRLSTLYAYVSRGVIAREPDRDEAGRRVSRFARADVLALAAARARPRTGDLSVLIESNVSELDPDGGLLLRGTPVAELVAGGSFEDAARSVLQTDEPWPVSRPVDDLPSAGPAPDGWRRADLIREATLLAAGQDRDRDSLDAGHCRRVAMQAVEAGCAALAGSGGGGIAGSVATRLTAALGGRPDPQVVRCVDVALILLIDHELTASTLATRAAAGVGADPWMAILAGQCAMSGPSQASASRAAVAVLREWIDGTAPDGPAPGFGHRVYTGPDPRFELLAAEVAAVDATVAEQAERLCVQVSRTRGRYPNVDLALAALIVAADLPDDAGEVLFTVARTIGLACHAIEEYPHGLRLRPRALAGDTVVAGVGG